MVNGPQGRRERFLLIRSMFASDPAAPTVSVSAHVGILSKAVGLISAEPGSDSP